MNLRQNKKAEQEEDLGPLPFKIGKTYIFRTVAFANVGKIKSIKGKWIILTNASWIADTGDWAECLRKPDGFKNIEPFNDDVFVAMDAIVDATPYYHSLPTYKEK